MRCGERLGADWTYCAACGAPRAAAIQPSAHQLEPQARPEQYTPTARPLRPIGLALGVVALAGLTLFAVRAVATDPRSDEPAAGDTDVVDDEAVADLEDTGDPESPPGEDDIDADDQSAPTGIDPQGAWTVLNADPGRTNHYLGPAPGLERILWSTDLPAPVAHPPLAPGDDYLYLADLDGQLIVVNAEGQIEATVPYGVDGLTLGAISESGMLLSHGGSLAAVDATGELLWSAPTGGAPVLSDGLVVVARGLGDGRLYGLNPADGSERWQFNVQQGLSKVAAGDGIAVVQDGDGALYGVDTATGRRVWIQHPAIPMRDRDANQSLGSEPVVHEGKVIVGSAAGQLLAYDLQTGAQLWELLVAEPPRFGLAAADGTAYFSNGDLLSAVNADTGDPRWQAPLPDRGGVPSVAGGRVVVSAIIPAGPHEYAYDTIISVFDTTSGDLLAQQHLVGATEHAPIIRGGTVYVMTSRSDRSDEPPTFALVALR